METSSRPAFTYVTRSYYLLTKPGIIMGNAITASGAFLLESRGQVDLWIFLSDVFRTLTNHCIRLCIQ